MTAVQWGEFSFINDDDSKRFLVAFRVPANQFKAVSLLVEGLSDAREALVDQGVSGCNVMPLAANAAGVMSQPSQDDIASATPFVRYVFEDGLNLSDEDLEEGSDRLDEDERKAWKDWFAAARALDAMPGPRQQFVIDWVWDNGGGDDNLFGDCASRPVSPQADALWEKFKDGVQALEEIGHWYDSAVSEKEASVFDKRVKVAALAKFAKKLKPCPPAFGALVDYLVSAEMAFKMEKKLPAGMPPSRPRM